MPRSQSSKLPAIIAILTALYSFTAMADVSRLQELVNGGNYAQAYSHAQSLLSEQAGDPQFDYLLGIAAYHSDHTGEAIFALQRVLMTQPGHQHASLLLGRAYYRENQLASAYTTLNRLIQQNPDTKVASQAHEILKKIHGRQKESLARPLSVYLQYSVGSDSNINAATEEETIINGSSIILLTPGSTETEDDYSRITVGVNGRLPMSERISLLMGIRQYENNNEENPLFDTRYTKAQTGFAVSAGFGELILPLQRRTLRVGADDFQHYNAAALGWQRYTAGFGYHGLLFERGSNHYQLTPERDSVMNTTVLHWKLPFKIGSLGLALLKGSETTDDKTYEYWSRDFKGIQASLSVSLISRHRQYISTKYLSSDYADIFPTFTEKREDSFSLTTIGWDWEFMPHVALRLSSEASKNASSIPIFDYKRKRSQLAIRFQY